MAKIVKRMLMGGAIAAVAGLGISGSVSAQTQPEDAWVKVCNTDPKTKKEFCFISQELRTDTGQFLAQAVVTEVSGEARKRLRMAVPPGMLLQPGLGVQIDGANKTAAKYSICYPNACFAEMVIDDKFIGNMKRGGKLVISTYNQQGKIRPFDLTLSGFTRVYDGEPIKPEELRAKQERLQSELQKRAEAARQRLIEQQRKASETSN
ncbi:invasion associated locus B family protein [Flexibacterium corallicola]|uniref:invasion associated locus B family protein n=1 Tax=Flexibacterium corallicola TaxID=3037259 RepID=UPI00286F2338|nr:invasion associated locus B family protein [Pseudovibrio sp. M1P-2-3]